MRILQCVFCLFLCLCLKSLMESFRAECFSFFCWLLKYILVIILWILLRTSLWLLLKNASGHAFLQSETHWLSFFTKLFRNSIGYFWHNLVLQKIWLRSEQDLLLVLSNLLVTVCLNNHHCSNYLLRVNNSWHKSHFVFLFVCLAM